MLRTPRRSAWTAALKSQKWCEALSEKSEKSSPLGGTLPDLGRIFATMAESRLVNIFTSKKSSNNNGAGTSQTYFSRSIRHLRRKHCSTRITPKTSHFFTFFVGQKMKNFQNFQFSEILFRMVPNSSVHHLECLK